MGRRWSVGLVAAGVLLTGGACGDDDDATSGTSAPVEDTDAAGTDGGGDGSAATPGEVTCVDDVGDSQAMLGQSAGDATVGSADLAEVVVRRTDTGIDVVATFASEHAAGNRSVKVVLAAVDALYPNAEVAGRESEGLEPDALVTRRPDQGTLEEGVGTVAAEGAVVTVSVAAAELGPVLDGPWQWEATSTAGLDGETAQDACGSTEAGAGSEIVWFPGPEG